VVVGDLLRIWWVEDEVWFRCRVVGMGRGGDVACVRYLVDERWGDYYHSLTEVTWETWSAGGEVDPEEARYELDTWVEPVDHEAVVAAEASRGRRERGCRGDGRGEEGGEVRLGEEAPGSGSDGGDGGGGSGRTTGGKDMIKRRCVHETHVWDPMNSSEPSASQGAPSVAHSNLEVAKPRYIV
jgi:hypothetical protein